MSDVIKVAGLSRDQVRRLDRLAKRADRTRSAYVRGLILGAIETEGMANDRPAVQSLSGASKPALAGYSVERPGEDRVARLAGSSVALVRSFDPDKPE